MEHLTTLTSGLGPSQSLFCQGPEWGLFWLVFLRSSSEEPEVETGKCPYPKGSSPRGRAEKH